MENYEADELGRYTSLSSLAVCSLLLGLASPVALLAPLFVVIPIAAIIVAAFTLVRIQTAAGGLSGMKLAYWGLALGIVCAVASPLRVKARDILYGLQADVAARQWLNLVAHSDTDTAVGQLTGNAIMGLAGPPSAEGPPPKPEMNVIAAKLSKDALVTTLREEAEQGELIFSTTRISCDATGPAPRAVLVYQTEKPDHSVNITMVVVRSASQHAWLDRFLETRRRNCPRSPAPVKLLKFAG